MDIIASAADQPIYQHGVNKTEEMRITQSNVLKTTLDFKLGRFDEINKAHDINKTRNGIKNLLFDNNNRS